MKKILALSLALLATLNFSCAKNSTSNTDNQPVTSCAQNPQLCNSNYYTNSYGFQPYNNYNSGSYFSNNGFYSAGSGPGYYNSAGAGLCNCPSGTIPTYNTYAGMGCVNSNFANTNGFSAYAYLGWGAGTNNSQWTNIPQVSNYVGYGNQSCYNGVVQSCVTDQPSTCAAGYSCLASNAGSRMGLCVSNSSAASGPIFR